MSWRQRLTNDPTPWLLEPNNPPVRYGTLRDLLGRPADDADLLAARAAIPAFAPVAALLAAQEPQGYWVRKDHYLPKHTGTFWVLIVLADLGLTREHPQIARAGRFMFGFQRGDGGFYRYRRVSGKGLGWDDRPEPCTHARIVRFLLQFGYGGDPRLHDAIAWLVTRQRPHGAWDCGRPDRPGCLRATLDVLRLAALEPELARHPAMARGAAWVAERLMGSKMARYHVGLPWTTLQWPYFDYSVISALDALAHLGYTLDHPRVAEATEYLLSRQLPDGAWPVDHVPHDPPFDVGEVRRPNKYLTLDALRVLKLLYR
jgi:hypothetical protein